MASPTSRTLKLLRQTGHIAGVVERYNHHAKKKADLFGCGDILACHPDERTVLLIQCTTAGHIAHRLDKARRCHELAVWLAASQRFEVWGWHQVDGRWIVRRVELKAGDVVVDLTPRRRPRRARKGERQGNLFEVQGAEGES